MSIEEIEYTYLNIMYKNIYNSLIILNKLINDSVLISLLKLRKNNIYKILNKCAINKEKIPENILEKYIKIGYIIEFENYDQYILSINGIWYIEEKLNKINLNSYLNYLNIELFNFQKHIKNIGDSERLILFSMISARAFSQKSSVNLNQDSYTINKWNDLFIQNYYFLFTNKIIETDLNKIFGKTGNIHPLSNLFRQNNNMIPQTKNIYKSPGKQIYYLDILKNNDIEIDKLSYLFSLIFKEKPPVNIVDEMINICNQISREYSVYFYNAEDHKLSLPQYDKCIKNALYNYLLKY